MTILLIQHPESRRKITVRVNESLLIQSLIDSVVEKLELSNYDSYALMYIDYSLKLVGKDGKTQLLPREKLVGDQLKDGDHLILESSSVGTPISNSEFGLATISVGSSWSVKELEQLLHSLDEVYTAIFAYNEILLENKHHGQKRYDYPLKRVHETIVSNMGAHEQLRVSSININSPGIAEIIGALNPLETIRQFLKDHQEAKLANQKMQDEKEKAEHYGDAIEQAKATLEIETLKNNVAKERMLVLRDAGFSQEELRPYVKEFLEKPLHELLIYQEQKQVEIISVVSLGMRQIEIVRDSQKDEYQPLRRIDLSDS